jgi:hypothetical protein
MRIPIITPFAAAFALLATPALAVTLDFDALTPGTPLLSLGVFATEDGYNIEIISAPGYISPGAPGNNTPQLAAYFADDGATAPVYRFTRTDGGTFQFTSVDLFDYGFGSSGTQPDQIVNGFLGGSLEASQTHSIGAGWQTYGAGTLAGVTLDALTISLFPGNVQKGLDNVVLDTANANVPSGGTTALMLGLGLLGLGAAKRKLR